MKYGWKPQLPDQRDHIFSAAPHIVSALPPSVDLRPLCPPVLDQGQLGSCTANAIASAHRFDQMLQKDKGIFAPARLFIYYNERAAEGTIRSDSGAAIRDGIKSIASLGVCDEALVPYNINTFTKKPVAAAYKAALKHRSVNYQAVPQTLDQIRACLVNRPFVFGFTVYESFESAEVAKTGIVPMPAPHEKTLGGHAVLCVGYDDASQRFTVMNSWGTGWAQQGFFTIPYAYLAGKLASDFWVVQTVMF